jgi:hypothetical protein
MRIVSDLICCNFDFGLIRILDTAPDEHKLQNDKGLSRKKGKKRKEEKRREKKRKEEKRREKKRKEKKRKEKKRKEKQKN